MTRRIQRRLGSTLRFGGVWFRFYYAYRFGLVWLVCKHTPHCLPPPVLPLTSLSSAFPFCVRCRSFCCRARLYLHRGMVWANGVTARVNMAWAFVALTWRFAAFLCCRSRVARSFVFARGWRAPRLARAGAFDTREHGAAALAVLHLLPTRLPPHAPTTCLRAQRAKTAGDAFHYTRRALKFLSLTCRLRTFSTSTPPTTPHTYIP